LTKKLVIVFALSVLVFCTSLCELVIAGEDWASTLYAAQVSIDSLGDTLEGHAHFEDSYLLALALSKKITSFGEYVDVEIEGQAVKHFGDQDHWEFNGLPVVRWYPMPWDKLVDTNLAIGAGFSYALKTPPLEEIDHPNTPKLLGYLMFEVTFSADRISRWSFVTRIHHRSGANGLFGKDRADASNAVGFGVRYKF
jgi:hypothetical protein